MKPYKMKQFKVSIIGGGNMGLAFAKALIQGKIVDRKNLLIVDRSIKRKPYILKELRCRVAETLISKVSESDIVVLSVKPQNAAVLLTSLKPIIKKNQLVISLMTGIKLKELSQSFNDHKKLVRAMPNLPAHVGRGVTVYKSDKSFTRIEKETISKILGSAGISLEVKNEALLDSATAVTATGPAYFFYFLEHMTKAAKDLGFNKDDAEMLIKETMRGSLELWATTGLSPEELRKRVTSKGGTTKAAMEVFDNGDLGKVLQRGIKAAHRRAVELSRSLSQTLIK